MTPPNRQEPRDAQGEVHRAVHDGELVVNPDDLDRFLADADIHPPHEKYEGCPVEVEVRAAVPDQDPPTGALWLTATDAHVSLKADPAEVLRVLHEAGIVQALDRAGRLPFRLS